MLKWEKLGLVFETSKWILPFGCESHAQAPQVLPFDDFFRVYFSSRSKDETGKFYSHVVFGDFSHDWEVLELSKQPVIGKGALGCFDEHGIFPFHVTTNGNEVLGFIGGWNRRVSVPIDGAIGLSKSTDNGITFIRVGDGPVLGPSLNEPCLVGDPFVLASDGKLHMWYIYGKGWAPATESEPPARVYKISVATSVDGFNWVREGKQIISNVLGDTECQAMPTVFKASGIYHMIFCFRYATDFRANRNRGYTLGYAYSTDLINWHRDDNLLGIQRSESGWDSDMMCYPHVFEFKGNYYLLYNGNEFGKHGFGVAVLR